VEANTDDDADKTTDCSPVRGHKRNESAASFAWLVSSLGIPSGTEQARVTGTWTEIRDRMRRPREQTTSFLTDWTSDPWLAKGVKGTGIGTIAPSWDPPDRIDEWPSYGTGQMVDALASPAKRTRHRHLSRLLALPHRIEPGDAADALGRLLRMEAETSHHGDTRMVASEHVRAWLSCSVGSLLRGPLLDPDLGPGELTEVTLARLAIPRQINLPRTWAFANQFAEKHLDLLYNLEVTPDGRLSFLDTADIRVGQGEGWREHWGWLSRDIRFQEMGEALRLAACLMRRPALVEGLLQAMGSDDQHLRTIALAVTRRWLLSLKAMAWLEDAARKEWTHVRAADLACFAFSALKPEWPRRAVGVSHRSSDAKQALSRTELWSSSRCAIDASYVPSWETNTGMVWGLFGATPAIVRVRSPGYGRSLWCLREAELTRHLVERSDFLSERWVVDLDLADLGTLDTAYSSWDRDTKQGPKDALGVLPEFPPLCHVWTPSPMPAWEVAMLRASAALRAVNTMLASPELTNRFVAEFLLGDTDFPGSAPTDNPGGWQAYRAIFRRFQSLCTADDTEPALRLPLDYSAEQMALDLEMLDRVPDLSTGAADLGDVLVAYEFLRTEWPLLRGQRLGRFLAVSVRDLTRERWARDECLSLQRGLLSVRTPVPVLIIQHAGQGVEGWPMPGDHPIFTEHFPQQFSWMMESSLDRREAQSLFAANSGLVLSAAVRQRCHAGG
jgi:hypothetical protein